MRRIDELHLDYPFVGSRMLRDFALPERHQDGTAARGKIDEASGD
jgi:hypothetical protein